MCITCRSLFLPIFEWESVFYWQEDPNKIQQGRKSGKWLQVEITAVKGPKIVISAGASIFQVSASKLRRPLDTVDLEELPDSRERTGSPVLWLPCEGQTDVWELFSDNAYLSAILDPPSTPQKKVESFPHPSYCRAFGQSSRKRIPRLL